MKHKVLLGFVLTVVLFSCKQKSNQVLKKQESGQILLPPNFEIYNSDLSKTDFQAGGKTFLLKIFTTINVSCASCILQLEEWKKIKRLTKNCPQTLIIPVCTSKDNFEMIKFIVEEKKINDLGFPLVLDSSKAFEQLNKQFLNHTSYLSVLTDADNRILLTGNPIEDSTERKLFINTICKFKN